MPKVMEIIEKETKGKSYHTYKYSYDSIGLPSIDYDDDPNKVMKWKDSGETDSPKGAVDLKHLADQLQQLGETPLLKYFLDGSRHVFKVDDIAYNKQVFPVVAGQIGVGCCRRENKRMQKERFYRELVLALPDKANADGWDDAAYFAAKVKKLNESEELMRLGLHFSAILPYATSKAGSPGTKLENLAVGVIQDYMVEAEKRMVAELVRDKRLGQDAYLLKDGSLEYVFFLAKCLKDQSDIEIITEKDYISHPKPNGYRSLHLTIRLPVFFAGKEIHVPVEIQLRTIAMDFWASLEHTIRYKKNLPMNAEIETELKECADSSREWDTKMERLLHLMR